LDEAVRLQWLNGLSALDTESRRRSREPFVGLNAAQVETLLTDISRNERAPQTPLETFFVLVKTATIQGFYTSEIGIHKELQYKGNQLLPTFVGCLTEDGKDCPHCGQRA
jgi:hypothetical protein